MNKKVLVAFSSKFGYVSQIANNISDILSNNGIQVELLDLGKIKKNKWPLIDQYDGIIIGSCMTSLNSFWRKEAKKFVNLNINKLSNTEKPLGVFYSDPRHLNLIIDPEGAKKLSENIMKSNFGFIPKYCNDFGPAFDLGHGFKNIPPEDRDRIRSLTRKISKKTGIEFNYKGFNDFRDWGLIQEFAQKFSDDIVS